MSRYTDYREVARLSQDAVVALSRTGDAQERVWAAWALGVRGGQEHRATLRESFVHDPDEGVRRHVLIVLVGLGEQETLRQTVARDGNPYVRATATCLLARQTEPTDAVGYDLLVARSIDLSWVVRYAVADATRGDAPEAVVRAIAGLLFDPDELVGARMRERVESDELPRAPFEAALAVLRRAERVTLPQTNASEPTQALLRLRQPLRLL